MKSRAALRRDMDLSAFRERVSARFLNPDECWRWTTAYENYGAVRVPLTAGGRATIPANRAAYLAFVGDLPEGSYVCHRCGVKGCVNPRHLYAGSPSDNMRDRFHGDRMHLSDAERVFRIPRRVLRAHLIEGTQHVRRADVEKAAA